MAYRILNIDPKLREIYTKRDGEPPLIFEDGLVLYYDRKAGKYYNARTDMYISDDEYYKLMRRTLKGAYEND